jgi:hypothetical protein
MKSTGFPVAASPGISKKKIYVYKRVPVNHDYPHGPVSVVILRDAKSGELRDFQRKLPARSYGHC